MNYNDIFNAINTINSIFTEKYQEQGFLEGTYHTPYSFFTTGACWYYAALLKRIFPEGDIYLGDQEVGHVIFKYGEIYVDVSGPYTEYRDKFFYIDEEGYGRPWYDHSLHNDVVGLMDNLYNDYILTLGKDKVR